MSKVQMILAEVGMRDRGRLICLDERLDEYVGDIDKEFRLWT